jgi:hypothetical protein
MEMVVRRLVGVQTRNGCELDVADRAGTSADIHLSLILILQIQAHLDGLGLVLC